MEAPIQTRTKGDATMENENREQQPDDAQATEDLEVREGDAEEVAGGVRKAGGGGGIESGQRA